MMPNDTANGSFLTPVYRGTTFLVGPFLGPALAGYILYGSNNQWVIPFGLLTALYGFSTLLIVLFGYETFYDGRQSITSPLRARVCSFFGIGNTQRPKGATLATQSRHLVSMTFKLPLLLPGSVILLYGSDISAN
jgi:hypothetical protein